MPFVSKKVGHPKAPRRPGGSVCGCTACSCLVHVPERGASCAACTRGDHFVMPEGKRPSEVQNARRRPRLTDEEKRALQFARAQEELA